MKNSRKNIRKINRICRKNIATALCKLLLQGTFKGISKRILKKNADGILKGIKVEILNGFINNMPEKKICRNYKKNVKKIAKKIQTYL